MTKDDTRSRVLILALILVSLTVIFAVSTDQSSAATIDVGPSYTYTTINSGIAASSANDEIIVHHNPNNYTENVVVNKQGLKIKRASGEDVTVQTTGSGTVFSINSVNNITIDGFKIKGNDATQGTGISLSNANYCSIINNVINTRWKGISISGSHNNITNNFINDTLIGMGLSYPSNNNTINQNNITNPTYNFASQVRLGLREDGQYFGTWTPNQNNKYLNNIISNVNEGIFIQQGTNFNISGNNITIKDTTNYPWAITLSVGNTANQVDILSNNIITSEGKTNVGSRGIYLISNPSSPSNANLQIFSNSITNFTDGIYSTFYTPTVSSQTLIYLNRFYNNDHGLKIVDNYNNIAYTAINNWWGKNTTPTVYTTSPPAVYDIFYVGTLTYNPWIVLNVNASPTTINTGQTSTITAGLTLNSNGQDTTTLYPGKFVPNGIPANFSSDALGNVNPLDSTTTNGASTTTFTGNSAGVSNVSATVDAQTVATTVTINGPVLIPTSISVDPVSGFKGDTVDLTATLTDTQNNLPVTGKTIQFSVDGTVVGTAVTDINGLATFAYTITQDVGSYTILAEFMEDTPYAASSNTNSLEVLDSTPPVVTNTNPVNNALNVNLNQIIQITFNEAIQFGTNPWIEFVISGTSTVVPFTSSILGNVLSITPDSLLAAGTKFIVVLHSNSITDLQGNGLAAPYTTKFTTTTPPVVTSTNPVNNAVNVALNKVIQITFDKNIQFGTNPWIEFVISGTSTVVPFTSSILGNVLSITPDSLLAAGTKFIVVLHSNSITDLQGNGLAAPYTTKFTTTTPPVVTSTNPVNNAVNVALNKVIQITFDKNIQLGTNPWIELVTSSTGTAKAFTTTITGNILNITPTTPLTKGTKYIVVLHSNAVTDTTGTAGLAAPYTTKFTTTTV